MPECSHHECTCLYFSLEQATAPRRSPRVPKRTETLSSRGSLAVVQSIEHSCELSCFLCVIMSLHVTSKIKQFCHVENILCIVGSHTFVPRGWMCKKQTSVSHSSTESESISLGAGLHMDGIPALSVAFFFQPTSEIHRCYRNEPVSEFSRTCKETCRRKFRNHRRQGLGVA